MKKYLYIICLFLSPAFFLSACGRGIEIKEREVSRSDSFENRDESIKEDTQSLSSVVSGDVAVSETMEKVSEKILVHVCGRVVKPGVYELEAGARVVEAVEEAQGFGEDAASESINLARKLSDGERIYIPSREEASEAGGAELWYARNDSQGMSEEEKNDVININIADKEALMSLPGIGEAKADAIIDYRERSGGFQSIEDIMLIPGIKEAAFAKIKDRIRVR